MAYVKGQRKGKHLSSGSQLGAKTWAKEGAITWNQKQHGGPSREEGLKGGEEVLGSQKMLQVSIHKREQFGSFQARCSKM